MRLLREEKWKQKEGKVRRADWRSGRESQERPPLTLFFSVIPFHLFDVTTTGATTASITPYQLVLLIIVSNNDTP